MAVNSLTVQKIAFRSSNAKPQNQFIFSTVLTKRKDMIRSLFRAFTLLSMGTSICLSQALGAHPTFSPKPISETEEMKKVPDINPRTRVEMELTELRKRLDPLFEQAVKQKNAGEIPTVKVTNMDDFIPRLKAIALWKDDKSVSVDEQVLNSQREKAVGLLYTYFDYDSRALRAIDEIAGSYPEGHPTQMVAKKLSNRLIDGLVDPTHHSASKFIYAAFPSLEDYVQYQERAINILKERAPHNEKALDGLKQIAFESLEKGVWWPAQEALKDLSKQGLVFQARPPRELRDFLHRKPKPESAKTLSNEMAQDLKLLALDQLPLSMPKGDQKSAFTFLRKAAVYSVTAAKALQEIAESNSRRELRTWAKSTLDQYAEFESCVREQTQQRLKK
jgi:hypothetical protein